MEDGLVFAALAVVSIAVGGAATDGGMRGNRASAGGRSPVVVVEATLWSDALGKEMPYCVYLPPGYQSSRDARYPVLYMLHGLGGDHMQWANEGLFTGATDLMMNGSIPPFIIVTTEGERGYWMDHASNGPRFGTYVSEDLVSEIDGRYRTIPTREARAIGGLSMGAHGALQLALNNPDEFGVAGAHSLVLRGQSQAFSFFGDTAHFQAHDPVSLTRKDSVTPRRIKLWIDIGEEDPWFQAANAFHNQLLAEKVPHTWRIYAGAHNDAYWQTHVRDYLRFYGGSLRTSASGWVTASPRASTLGPRPRTTTDGARPAITRAEHAASATSIMK